jgi:hypothetical protein
MSLNKLTEFYTRQVHLSPNIASEFRSIAIFKNIIKNSDLNKACRYVRDRLLYQTS